MDWEQIKLLPPKPFISFHKLIMMFLSKVKSSYCFQPLLLVFSLIVMFTCCALTLPPIQIEDAQVASQQAILFSTEMFLIEGETPHSCHSNLCMVLLLLAKEIQINGTMMNGTNSYIYIHMHIHIIYTCI